jgi:hypothetical protein
LCGNGVIFKKINLLFLKGCQMSNLDWKALATLAIIENPLKKTLQS